jgi:DNA gyrase subunit B
MTDIIKTLDDRGKAREKISIWFGSADNYTHGIKEVVANSTDEIINHFEEGTVDVLLHDDKRTIEIKDSGRGIPMAGETDGVPNYVLLFLTLFAGTKYGEGGYTDGNFTGSNGLGLTVVNYTSTMCEITSVREGKKYHIGFANGGEVISPLTETTANKNEHGTTVKFRLDDEVYTNTEFIPEEVESIVKRYAIGSNKITINYKYGEKESSFHYDNLLDYYTDLVGDKNTSSVAFGEAVTFDDGGEQTSISIALSTTTEAIQESYLNLTHLSSGGKINDGIVNAVKLYANKYCKQNKLFPKNVNSFSDSDVEESISFVAVMLSNKVEFENQTKLSTQKNLYREVSKKRTTQILEIMEIEDTTGFKKIIDHLLLVQKDNTNNQKQKENLKKKLKEKVDNMVNKIDKFVDCRVHGEEAELYLAEGDSAHGSVVLARDGRFQASMPMGGKFLNVEKVNNIDAITSNDIVMNVIKVLGCGVDLGKKYKDVTEFDIKKLRYGKIICASDEDPDGAQIQCLVITMFNKLMPQIIHEGKLYIARTPLFEIKLKNDEMIYAHTDEERDSLIKEHGKNIVNISRVKGLGELEAEVMAETAMNPETRHLIQVTIDDVKKAQQSIDDWMGSDVTNRKEFISTNLNKYIQDALS